MNAITNPGEGGDKRLPETSVQALAQNLTTIQTVQSGQNVIQSSIQSQTIVGTVGQSGTLVGKSVSLDLNQKLSLAKPGIPSNIVSSTDSSKLTATVIILFNHFSKIQLPKKLSLIIKRFLVVF